MSAPRSEQGPDQHIPGGVWVLAGVAFAVALGFGVVAPAIPLFAVQYGVGKTAIGLAISAFAFFRFVSALGAGSLVDRLGERRVLVVGLLTVAVTTSAAPLADNYVGFVALRGIGGVGSAAFTVAATSLVLRLAPAAQRGRATNRYQSGFLLGGMLGPAIGGPLTDVDARMPFFFYGGTLVIAAAVALIGLRSDDKAQRAAARTGVDAGVGAGVDAAVGRSSSAQPASEDDRGAVLVMLRNQAYLAAVIVNFGAGWMLFGVRNSLIPLYVVEDLGKTATFAGIGLLVGSVAQTIGILRAGWFTDTVGRRPATIIGSSLAVLAVGLLVLPGQIVVFLVSMAVLGLAASLLGSAPSAVVGDVSPAKGGKIVATFQMAADIGAVTGPLVAGWIADHGGARWAFAVSAGVLAVGLLAALRMPETRRSG